ncbi:MAG: hypothetical protein ACRDLT_12220 [Solirubrobacteraceae bacterium]
MALKFGLIAAIPGVATTTAPFVVLFGISYFFTEFGPNTTTGGVAAGVAVLGLGLTMALLPEPKGQSLEEIAARAQVPGARIRARWPPPRNARSGGGRRPPPAMGVGAPSAGQAMLLGGVSACCLEDVPS